MEVRYVYTPPCIRYLYVRGHSGESYLELELELDMT